MSELTSHEKKELKKEQKYSEKEKLQSEFTGKTNKSRLLKYSMALAVFLAFTFFVVKKVSAPGPYDDFAKCLKENGAVMYGADWCKFTQEQKGMFGPSFKYLDYHDFSERPDIKVTPTWIIEGKFYEKVQSFEKLSELTGCTYG